MMAMPTSTSAAATAITRKANTTPSSELRNRLSAANARFTALSISSMHMKTTSGLCRTRKPTAPMVKSAPLNSRKRYAAGISANPSHRQVHGADGGDQQEDGGHLDREEKLRVEGGADGLDVADRADGFRCGGALPAGATSQAARMAKATTTCGRPVEPTARRTGPRCHRRWR